MIFDMSNQLDSKQAMAMLSSAMDNDSMIEITIKRGTRTQRQNAALHLAFTQIAETLTEHGLDMKRTLSPEIDVPWDATLVKELLWRPVQLAKVGKESTSDLNTKEIDEVFSILQKFLNEKFNLSVYFPSIESLLIEKRGY